MRLTEKHQRQLARYLREVEAELSEMPTKQRTQAIARLQAHLLDALARITNEVPKDKDIEAVLSKHGDAKGCAEQIRNAEKGDAGEAAATGAIWLGVCLDIADRTPLSAGLIRLVFVLVGMTGVGAPLALLTYIAAHLYFYFSADPDEYPKIDLVLVAKRAAVNVGLTLLLYAGARFTVWFIYWAPARLLDKPRVALDPAWTWLERSDGSYLFWTVALGLPLAILSGLPVQRGWDNTLHKCSHTVLAFYTVALTFGVAGVLVGSVLAYVQLYAGMDVVQTVKQLMER